MRRIVLATMFFAATSLLPATARASIVTLNLDYVFTGDLPDSTSPYLTATFLDLADCFGGPCAAGTVQLLLEADLEDASEFVTDWGFNSAVSTLSISYVNGSAQNTGSYSLPGIDTTPTAVQFGLDGGGYYDILFAFATSNNSSERFDGTDSALFTITGTGITTATFNELAEDHGGNGTYTTAAHIQGITPNCSAFVGNSGTDNGGGNSGTCGTSVPDGGATLTLLGLALGGIGAVRRFMNS